MSHQQDFSYFPHLPPPVGVRLTTLAPRPCAYLPGRVTTLRALGTNALDPSVYHAFMDRAFRRSGSMLYQPVCDGCRECRPIRLRVDSFAPTRSQRRSRTRNADVETTIGEPEATPEKFALYSAYIAQWHGGADDAVDYDGFLDFLYRSPTRTIELTHRVAGRIVGVGICDLTPTALSSVYFYFDPAEARRSLGTFGALAEIDHARALGLTHYYLGYWVRDCPAMRYKAEYGPAEVLGMDGVWRGVAPRETRAEVEVEKRG